jgi:cell division GTPase FtsZ
MKLTVCGFGGAGGRIADRLVAADGDRGRSFVVDSVAVDTDQRDLSALDAIPDEQRHLYGVIEAEGEGVNGDRSVGAAAAESAATEVTSEIEAAVPTQTEAILCCVGLAGGSGATVLSRVAAEVGRMHDAPVYTLGVLPALPDDGDAERIAGNALRALTDLTSETDSVIVFDNELWAKSGESAADPEVWDRLNETIVERLAALFAAGEGDHGRGVAEQVVDASEVRATFEAGGIATLGYANQAIDRPIESRFGLGLLTEEGDIDETTAIKAIETTSRRAVNGKLTVEIDLDSVARGLLIAGGPPEWLNRQAIADARSWLAQETGSTELRGGDMPTPDRDEITMLALLTGIKHFPRIDELQDAAGM